jgi:hypothetical protein
MKEKEKSTKLACFTVIINVKTLKHKIDGRFEGQHHECVMHRNERKIIERVSRQAATRRLLRAMSES